MANENIFENLLKLPAKSYLITIAVSVDMAITRLLALLLSKQKYKFKVLTNPFLIHDGIKEETSGQSKTEQEINTKECFIK